MEGADATYYNPAALPWLKKTDVVFNHTAWFAGINHEFAAAAMYIEDVGAFGLSVTALYTDEMKVRTPLQPEGTGETFYVGNYRFGLSYARFLTDRVTFGLTISYINMKLYRSSRLTPFPSTLRSCTSPTSGVSGSRSRSPTSDRTSSTSTSRTLSRRTSSSASR